MGGGPESRYVGRVYGADGAVHATIQHVHTTYHPSTNSVQKTTCCNLISSAPDDGCMRLKHVELRIHE